MNVRSMVAVALLLTSLGCAARPTEQTVKLEPAELQLRHIGQAYTRAVQKLRRGPRDLEEFKAFLVAIPDSEATVQAIASRQIIVIWDLTTADLAVKSSPGAPPQYPVVAYFTTKEGDIRFVLTTTTRIERMTDEQFRKAYFPKGHKPTV